MVDPAFLRALILRALILGASVGLAAVLVIRAARRRSWPKWQEFTVMAGALAGVVLFWNLVWPEGA